MGKLIPFKKKEEQKEPVTKNLSQDHFLKTQERLQKERDQHNKKVLRSYRIKNV